MKIVKVNDLRGTSRDVDCPKGGFKSIRMLLEEDGMGYTLTNTFIPKGPPQMWHYKSHLETCYCISGHGLLRDLTTGTVHEIVPGTAYILDKHDAHEFQAVEDTTLICVFNPPLKGREVHGADGSYSG